MNLKNQVIMRFGVPNLNNITYTKEAVIGAIAKYNDRKLPLYGELGQDPKTEVDLNRVALAAENIKIGDGIVTADIVLLDTPMGEAAKDLVTRHTIDSFRFGPCTMGQINKDKTVTDFYFLSIDMINNYYAHEYGTD